MNRVFADSFYFFAVLSPKDRMHQKAREFATRHEGAIVTTAWVLTELADGLAVTAHRAAVSRLIVRVVTIFWELRADGKVHPVGKTRAGRWHPGPQPGTIASESPE